MHGHIHGTQNLIPSQNVGYVQLIAVFVLNLIYFYSIYTLVSCSGHAEDAVRQLRYEPPSRSQ